MHLPFQIEGEEHPPLHEGMAIIALNGEGMMVTSSTLRRRVAISSTLKCIYCLHIVYILYIFHMYQSEGMASSHQSEGDGPLLLKVKEVTTMPSH